MGTMCSSTASVGLTQDTGSSESSVGATATHELGHLMNMTHDDACELGCMYIYTYCVSFLVYNIIYRQQHCISGVGK